MYVNKRQCGQHAHMRGAESCVRVVCRDRSAEEDEGECREGSCDEEGEEECDKGGLGFCD
jgi:hypothetical protein